MSVMITIFNLHLAEPESGVDRATVVNSVDHGMLNIIWKLQQELSTWCKDRPTDQRANEEMVDKAMRCLKNAQISSD